MPKLITRRTVMVSAAAAAATFALGLPHRVWAETTTHEVEMLNKHPDDPRMRMVFNPRIIEAQPGDTIKFLPVDKGHNSQSTDGMLPEGAEPWKGKINEEIDVTLEQPGFYGYQCLPHYALGMVGLIIVKGDGMMDNLEAAKEVNHRGKAKAVWDDIWAEVDGMDLSA